MRMTGYLPTNHIRPLCYDLHFFEFFFKAEVFDQLGQRVSKRCDFTGTGHNGEWGLVIEKSIIYLTVPGSGTPFVDS